MRDSQVAGHAEFLGRIDKVNQMVWNPLLVGGSWLGRANVHSTINCDGIERQNLSADPLGQSDCDRTLS